MASENFELPQVSITNLTPNVTLATSDREDEFDKNSLGNDFSLVIID